MGYVERNLLKGEEVVYRASIHWAVFLPSIFWALLVIACLIGAAKMTDETDKQLFLIWAAMVGLVFLFSLIGELVTKLSAEYVLTNKRLVMKSGIIARNTMELVLVKCEGVSVDQSILGRILGYGTIWATTGGARNKYRKIASPIEFRNRINEQIDLVHSTN